jgi:hypothetical protein
MLRLRFHCTWMSLFACLSTPALSTAADKTCAALNKAGERGLKQARIHQAVDLLRAAVPKPNEKVTPLGENFMQTITIDKTVYMALDGITFSAETVKNDEERAMKSGVAVFSMIDEGCKFLGKATVAGRNADVYEAGSNKNSDSTYFKFWVDSQTGLPLKSVEDAPAPELNSFKVTKDGRPNIEVKKNKVDRVLNTIAFVFGDTVKPPKLTGAKNLFGQKGEVDPAAPAMLKAIFTSR